MLALSSVLALPWCVQESWRRKSYSERCSPAGNFAVLACSSFFSLVEELDEINQ